MIGLILGAVRVNIYPEDGNFNVYQNVGKLPIFDAAHNRKPKFYIENPGSRIKRSLTGTSASSFNIAKG
jgi:hypothetical protein